MPATLTSTTDGVLIEYVDSINRTMKCIISNDDTVITTLCNKDVRRFIALFENHHIIEKNDHAIIIVTDPIKLEYILKSHNDIIFSQMTYDESNETAYESFVSFFKRKMEDFDRKYNNLQSENSEMKDNIIHLSKIIENQNSMIESQGKQIQKIESLLEFQNQGFANISELHVKIDRVEENQKNFERIEKNLDIADIILTELGRNEQSINEITKILEKQSQFILEKGQSEINTSCPITKEEFQNIQSKIDVISKKISPFNKDFMTFVKERLDIINSLTQELSKNDQKYGTLISGVSEKISHIVQKQDQILSYNSKSLLPANFYEDIRYIKSKVDNTFNPEIYYLKQDQEWSNTAQTYKTTYLFTKKK